jgi:hypothetical protein
MRSVSRIFLLAGLATNWLLLILSTVVWLISEFRKLELVINWRHRYVLLEFSAVEGEFYIGTQRFGIEQSFLVVVAVLLVWPVVHLSQRLRRARKARGQEVLISKHS